MAKGLKDELLGMIRDGRRMTLGQQVQLALMLSFPTILAQTSSMLMQYIDTGIVGRSVNRLSRGREYLKAGGGLTRGGC